MRKLASIQEIINISPIEGADKIEVATVLGWHVVVKKGDFSVGDKCVYVEIDSLLPDKPEFEFMRDRKFRVKTIKLLGQISQGICFPMSVLPDSISVRTHKFLPVLIENEFNIGDDVSDIIGVLKYEDDSDMPEEPGVQETKKHGKLFNFAMRYKFVRNIFFKFHPRRASYGDFPTEYVSKTDETRIQSMPSIVEECKDLVFSGTEKIDGMSVTFLAVRKKRKIDYLVCSRNRIAGEGSQYAHISKKYDIERKLKDIIRTNDLRTIAIQGEIIGNKIQGNKYHLTETELRVFNLKYNNNYVNYDELVYLCAKLDLTPVDEVFRGMLPQSVDEIVEISKGNSLLYPRNREGIVFRPAVGNSTISFKAINPDFLLEQEKKTKQKG